MSCRSQAFTFFHFPARFSHNLQNEYDIALELMDRARSIFKEAYGETHQWIADTLNARASVFIDLVSAFLQELCRNIACRWLFFWSTVSSGLSRGLLILSPNRFPAGKFRGCRIVVGRCRCHRRRDLGPGASEGCNFSQQPRLGIASSGEAPRYGGTIFTRLSSVGFVDFWIPGKGMGVSQNFQKCWVRL